MPVQSQELAGTAVFAFGETSDGYALGAETIRSLREFIAEAEADPAMRLVVLRGSADDFCSGMELSGPQGNDDQVRTSAATFFDLLLAVTNLAIPVVAVLEGEASGGGVGIAAACDLVIMGPTARMRLPELLWGLTPSCIFPFVARRTGAQHAMRLALTAEPIDAKEAYRIGLADQAVKHVDRALRRYRNRLEYVDRAAASELKRLRSRCERDPAQSRTFAVEQLSERLECPAVQARLDAFAQSGTMPWVSHSTPG